MAEPSREDQLESIDQNNGLNLLKADNAILLGLIEQIYLDLSDSGSILKPPTYAKMLRVRAEGHPGVELLNRMTKVESLLNKCLITMQEDPPMTPHQREAWHNGNAYFIKTARCDHKWVSTHNPPVVIGGELCLTCSSIRAALPSTTP
jgi:hypothetical protein